MKEELIEIFDGKKIYVDTDEWRGNRVKELKGTQQEKIKSLANLIETEKYDLFLDIGANYGEFAIALAHYNIPILCFEPNPICVQLLNKTFKNIDNVKVIDGAAGSIDEHRSFYYSKHYSGGGSFGKGVIQLAHHSKGEIEEIYTRVYRIDDYIIENYNPLPKKVLIKMDVEGFEDEVFTGCQKILEQCKWKALIETNFDAVLKAEKDPETWFNVFNLATGVREYGRFGNNDDILIGN